jgi:hypothetical protein
MFVHANMLFKRQSQAGNRYDVAARQTDRTEMTLWSLNNLRIVGEGVRYNERD